MRISDWSSDVCSSDLIKAHERALAIEKLDRRKAERRREVRALAQQRERLDRRQSRGAKDAAKANQAAILLGLQKQRSQHRDRKSVVSGKGVSVRVDHGGRRNVKKQRKKK